MGYCLSGKRIYKANLRCYFLTQIIKKLINLRQFRYKFSDTIKSILSNTQKYNHTMVFNKKYLSKNILQKIADFIKVFLFNGGRVLLNTIGLLMVIFGIIFLLGLFSSVFGLSFLTNSSNIQAWIDLLLLDGKDFYFGLTGIAILFGTPTIMMIYVGVKILFKIRYSNHRVNLSAGIIWLAGLILLIYLGIITANDFGKTAKIREYISVTTHNTLFLKMHKTTVNLYEFNSQYKQGEKKYSLYNRYHNYMIETNNGIKYLYGCARLNIIKSQTEKIILVVVKEAKGIDKRAAIERAKNISYQISQKDSIIEFDNLFKINRADKFRLQDITVILKLPLNKIVYIDRSIENLMYDIDNVTNTHDRDMINHRWVMTEKGLKCLDCD